ncbi:hypothetical protein BGZ51_008118 [Haplosporangium sp. Z 767]|nr:hypothetical protein BGZ51_008118 [Haplosporangium sp. Z 767]KAF9180241.1 hypothetical protein BGZ50_006372 [Haplosporangium sp. Z 11]
MIRTKQAVSGTLLPIIPTSTATTTTSTLVTSAVSASTFSTVTTTNVPNTSTQSASPTTSHLPESPAKSSTLSPLVIGLISAGCVTLFIALVAIFLLLRTRRQSKGDTDDFMSLHDQPSSLTGGSMDQQGEPTTAAEPVLTAGDAQLIAETFRKSMRKPRWEDEDDEDEQDEARRAAKELLRKELNEEGVDVQRGVQRRVTIRDRPYRSSVAPPLSQTISIPEP